MLKDVVAEYLKLFSRERAKLNLLLDQLEAGDELDDRNNFRGHVAGDAIILSPDLSKVLLIFHKRSGRWQQPGGHLDPGEVGPWLTAEREAVEETGVKIARRVNISKDERVPLHIVTGPVLANSKKQEPEHWHHDFRYAFVAESEDLGRIEDEGVDGAKWLPLPEALNLTKTGHELQESLRRVISLLGLKA